MRSLVFWKKIKIPLILQAEAAECGLACLAMLANYHGKRVDLTSLRSTSAISLKGTTLDQLIDLANGMGFSSRGVSADLESLVYLKTPAILHWNFNHFVVLSRIQGDRVEIYDPASGIKWLTMDQVSKVYTGVALELAPESHFEKVEKVSQVKLWDMFKGLPGIWAALRSIFLLALALQVFSVATPFFMQLVVDSAVLSKDVDLVALLGVGFLMLAFIQVMVTAVRSWVVMVLGTSLDYHMQSSLFSHLLRLPLTFFERRHIGDIISRFDSLKHVQDAFTKNFIETVVDGLMVLITLVVMFVYSVKLTLVVVLATVLYGILRLVLYQPLRMASEEQIVYGAKQQSHFLESVRAVQSIKLYGVESRRGSQYRDLMVDSYNAGVRVQKISIVYRLLNGFLFGAENVGVIWLGGLLAIQGAFSVGMLFAFIAYKRQFIGRTSALIDRLVEFKMLNLHLQRISDIALEKPEFMPRNAGVPKDYTLQLDNIGFRFSEQEAYLFQNINFSVEQGESVAIVGPSGTGKSTLLKNMLGLLQPSEGMIWIGGKKLQGLDQRDYRASISAVMQEDQLLAGSIRENIAFGETSISQERVEKCADLAEMSVDIAAMPMGYNTLIGDMGAALSSGQKQRVLLARALYREPKILFLDEATSHLDVACEKRINASLKQLAITKIVVAHRPQTIASADRVIRLTPAGIKEVTVSRESAA